MSAGTLSKPADREVSLSVVVITQNEADRVEDCLDSVFAACRRAVSTFEVILVDSASSDGTVERASEYPVSILRIPDEHVISCGAGRYVGDAVASGELTLHVDGDMRLSAEWLVEAVSYLRDQQDVAGVEGCLNEVDQDGVVDVDKIGGVMLFDTAALDAVGGFDPWLVGYEDIDVGYRLTDAGYRLVRLPVLSAEHPEDDTLFEPLRRWRAGYLFASGQMMRKSIDSPRIVGRLIVRQKYKTALFLWLCAGAVALTRRRWLAGWIGVGLLAALGLVAIRGPRGAARFGTQKALALAGIPVGLSKQPRPVDEYPLGEVERVQTGDVQRTERAISSR